MNNYQNSHLKSSKISSYEIMFCILDSIDIINELNSKIDHNKGNVNMHLKEVFKNLEVIQCEVQNLITYWKSFKTKLQVGDSSEQNQAL